MIQWTKFYKPGTPEYEEAERFEKEQIKSWHQELVEKGYTPQFDEDGNSTSEFQDTSFYGDCDHPSTMENSTATVLWIVVMIISLLFKGGWILCILETIAWWKHITRHKK